jgi:hypothetical protein
MLRGILGVVVGGVAWWMAFFGIARLLYSFWPAYATTARAFMFTGVVGFTTPMYACNALFWVLAEIAAGWIAVVIARRRESAWVLAALLMTFLCFMHLYLEWDRFAGWYNVAVALPSGPAVLLGGWLARGFAREPGAAASPGAGAAGDARETFVGASRN